MMLSKNQYQLPKNLKIKAIKSKMYRMKSRKFPSPTSNKSRSRLRKLLRNTFLSNSKNLRVSNRSNRSKRRRIPRQSRQPRRLYKRAHRVIKHWLVLSSKKMSRLSLRNSRISKQKATNNKITISSNKKQLMLNSKNQQNSHYFQCQAARTSSKLSRAKRPHSKANQKSINFLRNSTVTRSFQSTASLPNPP